MTIPALFINLGGHRYRVVGSRPEIAAFWRRAEAGRWEDDTFRFLDATAGGDAIFVDIGAWVGPMSLYASSRVGRVLAFEPDPVAFQELSENMAANVRNVEVRNAAVDERAGSLRLYAPEGLGRSVTSSIGTGQRITVQAVTFDDIDAAISPGARIVLKVDIEGHEYRVIETLTAFAKRRKAATHLSLHPRFLWEEHRRLHGWRSARLNVFKETLRLIRKLEVIGPVVLATGKRVSPWVLFGQIFLKRRPKNFSVEVKLGPLGSSSLAAFNIGQQR